MNHPNRLLYPTIWFLILFIGSCLSSLRAQSGCTDPLATNYAPLATQNDGSCAYTDTYYAPPPQTLLPDTLDEISGIVLAGNRWWVHNDSGNDHDFFQINPQTGAIIQTVKLKQADNKDWEDITASATHLYIGDIGNNDGDRQNLGVYKIKLTDIGPNPEETVSDNDWKFIPYAYDDQTDFSNQGENVTEYDAEALTFFSNNLHVFTKKWLTRTTTHYRINQTTDIAETVESFDTQGLITAADVSPDGKTVALLGYNKDGFPNVFLWLLWDFTGDHFFSGNKRKIELGTVLTLGKAEAIGFSENCKGYIANEVLDIPPFFVSQSIHNFDICQWVNETSATHDAVSGAGFSMYPNPFSEVVHFQGYLKEKTSVFRVINSLGQTVLQMNVLPEQLDTRNFPAGHYTFDLVSGGQVFSVKGIKQ